MWIYANPNPCRQEEPDCVVRAISLAMDRPWREVHWDLCALSNSKCTMPSVNWLWELYLKENGFEKFLLPESCPTCINVRAFCRRFRKGTYVVGTGSHAICIRDGSYLDTWNSGDTIPTFFFRKKGE